MAARSDSVARKAAKVRAQLSAPQAYVARCLESLTLADGWKDDPALDKEKHWPAMQRFADKEWFFHSDKNGRLHHNLTSLPTAGRKWVRLGGEHLVEHDYAALHPNLILSIVPDGPERQKLVDWISSDFYSHLAEKPDPKARKRAKKQFNSGVNDTVAHEGRYPAFKVFAREFPETVAMVRGWKTSDHCNAANVLQKLEAKLVFAEIVATCMAERVPVVSLHDALFSTPADSEFIREEKGKASRRLLGLTVGAKVAA